MFKVGDVFYYISFDGLCTLNKTLIILNVDATCNEITILVLNTNKIYIVEARRFINFKPISEYNGKI